MLSIDFFGKGLGLVFPPQFMYEFSRKNVSHDQNLLSDYIYLLRC